MSWYFIYRQLKFKPFLSLNTKIPRGFLLHGFRAYAEHLADFLQLFVSRQRFLFQVLVAHAKLQHLSQQSHLVLLLLSERNRRKEDVGLTSRSVDSQHSCNLTLIRSSPSGDQCWASSAWPPGERVGQENQWKHCHWKIVWVIKFSENKK